MTKLTKYSEISGQDGWRLYHKRQLGDAGTNSWDWAKWKKKKNRWCDELRGLYVKKIIRAYDYNAGRIWKFQHGSKTYYAIIGFHGWDYGYKSKKKISINDLYILNNKGKQELVKRGFITDFQEVLNIAAGV
jgi:hypothetical protein